MIKSFLSVGCLVVVLLAVMSDSVGYAGPAAPAAGSPAVLAVDTSSSSVAKASAHLTLKAADDHQDIVFHIRQEQAVAPLSMSQNAGALQAWSFKKLCVAPCEVTVPAGREVLALSIGTKAPVLVKDRMIDLQGNLTLDATYIDNSKNRAAGLGIFMAGLGAGAVGAFIAAMNDPPQVGSVFVGDPGVAKRSFAPAYVGVSIMSVAVVIGIFLGITGDVAQLEVTPTLAD